MELSEAVRTASKYLPEAFSDSADKDLRLEGAEKSNDEKYWWVTLSYPRQGERLEPFYREYRTLKVRDADGALLGARNGTYLPDAA